MYFETFLDVVPAGSKRELLEAYIFSSIQSGKPIRFYLPVCLRYYYDESGTRRIIGGIDKFEYQNASGERVSKNVDPIVEDLRRTSIHIQILRRLGLQCELILPVMDNEIHRDPNLQQNGTIEGINQYREEMAALLCDQGTEVVSSLQHFGTPHLSPLFQQGIHDVLHTRGYPQRGITAQAFEHTVNNRHESISGDRNIAPKYRSREDSRRSREFALGEGFFHSRRMHEIAIEDDLAGVCVFIPRGAEFDKALFNLEDGLVVLSGK